MNILGDLLCDVKIAYKTFSAFVFLKEIYRIASKMADFSREEDKFKISLYRAFTTQLKFSRGVINFIRRRRDRI